LIVPNGRTTISIIWLSGLKYKDICNMLLDLLSKYLENVEAAIRKLEGVYVEHYEEEILATNRQNNLVFR